MKRLILAVLAVLTLSTTMAAAQSRVQAGLLSCTVAPGIGLILGSYKDVTCQFRRSGFPTETYTGNITKVGLDVGITGRTQIEWLVFAATGTQYTPHALAGRYVGASGEASFGVGLGANWLVGGSKRSWALQPLSVQGQIGINASLAIASLTLK